MGALGALDVALQFGAPRGDHKQLDPPRRTGRLKRSPKLTAPVDLQCPDGKGHPPDQVVQEGRGGLRRRPAIDFHHVIAADHVPCGELLPPEIRHHEDIERVHLHPDPPAPG